LTRVRDLLALRRREIVPRLGGASFGEAKVAASGLLTADWHLGDGATLRLLANLSDREAANTRDDFSGTLIWGSELADSVPPWSVHWRIG
jgi:maltooligosyltrehalose trehalohydrolase